MNALQVRKAKLTANCVEPINLNTVTIWIQDIWIPDSYNCRTLWVSHIQMVKLHCYGTIMFGWVTYARCRLRRERFSVYLIAILYRSWKSISFITNNYQVSNILLLPKIRWDFIGPTCFNWKHLTVLSFIWECSDMYANHLIFYGFSRIATYYLSEGRQFIVQDLLAS